MTMDGDGVSQIVAALEVVHRPSSSSEDRRQAQGVSISLAFFIFFFSLFMWEPDDEPKMLTTVPRESKTEGGRSLLGLATCESQECQ